MPPPHPHRCPFPQPVLDEAARLQLGPPKYTATPLAPSDGAAASPGGEGGLAIGLGAASEDDHQRAAVAAAAAFRAVAREASGLPPEEPPAGAMAAGGAAAGGGEPACAGLAPAGPWRPFMALLLANERLTAPDHFQDTRHLEFDLAGSGLEYEPGDTLAIFPRTPEGDVQVGAPA